jgi:hypothetical protein
VRDGVQPAQNKVIIEENVERQTLQIPFNSCTTLPNPK